MEVESNEHSFLDWTGYFAKEYGLSESVFGVRQTFFEKDVDVGCYLEVKSVPSAHTDVFSFLNCYY